MRKSVFLIVVSVLTSGWFTGCAPDMEDTHKRALRVVEIPSSVMPADAHKVLVDKFNEDLFEAERFLKGNDFTLRWKAVAYSRNSMRGSGEYDMGVGYCALQAEILDAKGKVIRSRFCEGSQAIGFSRGPLKSAIECAAEYAVKATRVAVYPEDHKNWE